MNISDRRPRRSLRRRGRVTWLAVVFLGLTVTQGFHSRAMAHDMVGLFQPSVSDFVIPLWR